MTKDIPLSEKRFGLGKNVPEAIMNDMFFIMRKMLQKLLRNLKKEYWI